MSQARTKSHEAEERLLEVQIKYEGLQDLIAALKDGKGAQKVNIVNPLISTPLVKKIVINTALLCPVIPC